MPRGWALGAVLCLGCVQAVATGGSSHATAGSPSADSKPTDRPSHYVNPFESYVLLKRVPTGEIVVDKRPIETQSSGRVDTTDDEKREAFFLFETALLPETGTILFVYSFERDLECSVTSVKVSWLPCETDIIANFGVGKEIRDLVPFAGTKKRIDVTSFASEAREQGAACFGLRFHDPAGSKSRKTYSVWDAYLTWE